MEKTKEIHVRAIDLEKMIVFFSAIAEEIKGNTKIRVVLEHDPEKDRSVIEIFKTTPAETSGNTIVKPFLVDGGRFIVEADATNLETVMFSIRGIVDSKNIFEMFQPAEEFLKKIINDNGCSGN